MTAALLHAVLAAPDDDTPRLVYADWLEEHGDPRGAFIQMQCRGIAAEPVAAFTDALYGDLRRPEVPGKLGHLEKTLIFRFQRGFVHEVSGWLEGFRRRAAAIHAAEPVRALDLSTHGLPFAFEELPAPPRGLDRLALKGFISDEEAGKLAASAAHLGGLRALRLWGGVMLGNPGVAAVAASPFAGTFEEVAFIGTMINDEGARLLADPRAFPALRRLDLSGHQIRDAGARALVARPGLERLDLSAGLLSHAYLAELRAQAPRVNVDVHL